MASGEDENFNTACFRGRSMSRMSVGRILETVSVAAAAPLDSRSVRRQDEGLEGESLVGRNVVKRGLLNIDLNVAPPEDSDCELAAAEGGGKVDLFGESESVIKGTGEEVGGEVEMKKDTVISVDAEPEIKGEKNRRNRRWTALLEVAENELREKEEEEIRNRNRNRKRGPSPEEELGGDPQRGTKTQKKISGQRRQSIVTEWNGGDFAAVVRSSRGRAVAMPNKYRDSVLGAAAAELPRRYKSGKSATGFYSERKSR